MTLATAAAVACALAGGGGDGASAQQQERRPQRARPERRGGARPAPEPEEGGITVRARAEPGAATRGTFRGVELATTPGTGTDATRLVASQPGVARTPFGVGFFAVRGTSFENTGYLVDGFPVPVLYHFAAGPSVIPTRLIGSLDFYPGGYPLAYGRFTGGLVAIETRVVAAERATGDGELNIFGLGAGGAAPFDRGRGAVSLGVRRSYYDALLPLAFPGVNIVFGDAQLRVDYRFSERVRASLLVFGSMDLYDRSDIRADEGGSTISRDRITYDFVRAIGRLEYRAPGGAVAQLGLMAGGDDVAFVSGDAGRPDSGVSYRGATLGERASVRVPLSSALTATVGFDGFANVYDAALAFPALAGVAVVPPPQGNRYATRTRASITQFGAAPYFEGTLRAGRAEFTTGARVEVLSTGGRGFVLPEPRATLRVAVASEATLVAASGLFHQPPPFFALLPVVGEPGLLPQRAWQSSLGVEARLPRDLDARATLFFSAMRQLPRPVNQLAESADGRVRRVALASDGEGAAYGLELMVRRRVARGLHGWASYTVSRSERWVPGGRVVPFVLDQTHVLNVALSWEVTSAVRLGARFGLATGAPTHAIAGGAYDADANQYRPDFVAEGERLPLYHQLDLRVDYRFRWGPAQMTAYADLLNAYFARGTEGWNYQYDYANRAALRGLPILPVLGIKGEL